MVKIAAIRIVFATKNSSKCFCGYGSAPDPANRDFTQTSSWLGWKHSSHFPPVLDVSVFSIFGVSTRFPGTYC